MRAWSTDSRLRHAQAGFLANRQPNHLASQYEHMIPLRKMVRGLEAITENRLFDAASAWRSRSPPRSSELTLTGGDRKLEHDATGSELQVKDQFPPDTTHVHFEFDVDDWWAGVEPTDADSRRSGDAGNEDFRE
jgi:hypothetical protein